MLAALGKRESERPGTERLPEAELAAVREQAHRVMTHAVLAGVAATLVAIVLAAILQSPRA